MSCQENLHKGNNKKEQNLIELPARPSDAIGLAVRAKCSIWMLENVVAEASIPVNPAADTEDLDKFRRFLDHTNPAELIRHFQNRDEPFQESID